MRVLTSGALLIAMLGTAAAQQTPNTPSVSGSNNDLATQRTDPSTPKPYQPQNPAPDTRKAPTGSTTGKGPDSGGHPEAASKK
jgi:hypothetical protein